MLCPPGKIYLGFGQQRVQRDKNMPIVNAITIPIMTCTCESWTIGKEENKKLQTIFNELNKKSSYPSPRASQQRSCSIYHKEKENPTSKKNRHDEGGSPNTEECNLNTV